MEQDEKIIFTNSFGTISDKRVMISRKNGQEDIPMRNISSIGFSHQRNYFFAIGGFVLGIVLCGFIAMNLSNLEGSHVLILVILAIVGFLSGLANWIGHHEITIHTTSNNSSRVKVEMAKTREGRAFMEALRKEVILKHP